MKSLSDSVLKQQFPTVPLKSWISLIRHYLGFAKKNYENKLFFSITSVIYTNQDFPDTTKPEQIAKNQLDVEATKKAVVTQNQ